jgi:hydrogenase maturation protease
VGYRDLRDFSVGPVLVERLRRQAWPPGVEVEDLSSGAVHVLHWLQAQPPFDAAVFVAAVERGREPGCVHAYAWTAPTDTAEGVQQRIAEAVTGVIGLDTLLVVLGYFGALPPRVSVIEVEPRDEAWGESFSPPVEAALDEVSRLVRRQVEALVA